jgi:hypothetical protein
MVDHTSKITLTGEDKTGAMYKSAKRNADEYIKSLEKILQINESTSKALAARRRENGLTYKEQLETILKSNVAFNEHLKSIQAGTKATEQQGKAVKGVTGELMAMASRYLTVAAAGEAARRSFLAFAETDKKIALLGTATNLVGAALDEVGEKLKENAKNTTTSFEATYAGMEKLRNGMNITAQQATAMTTRLNMVAKGMGMAPEALGELTANVMRNLKIPREEFGKTLEMISASRKMFNIDMDTMASHSSELSQTFKDMGLEGINGLARMQAMLGSATNIMGNTTKGANLVIQTMHAMKSAQMADIFGVPIERWREQLEEVRKKGGDVSAYVANKLAKLNPEERRSAFYKMEQKQALLMGKILEENDGRHKKNIDNLKEATKHAQAMQDGFKMQATSADSVDALTESVKDLATEFGALLHKLGVTDAINLAVKKLHDLGDAVKYVGQWVKYIQGEGEAPGLGPVGQMLKPGALARRALTISPLRLIPRVNKFYHEKDTSGADSINRGLDEERSTGAAPSFQQQSYRGNGGNPLLHRISNQDDRNVWERGAAWVAGKAYNAQGRDLKQRGIPGSGGIRGEGGPGIGIGRGAMPGGGYMNAMYGGSSDSKFLPANFRGDGGGGGGQGGGWSGYGGTQYQRAGPTGGYGGGSGYGGQSVVPSAPSAAPGGGTVPRAAPGVGAERGRVGRGGDPRGMEQHIRETAVKYGIDPDTAVAVAKSEGLSTFQSSVKRTGKGSYNGREDSWGAFQLYKGGGLGNEFQKQTGLDPADPANEKATIDFALKHASKKGWGSWYGARNTGIGNFAGIGGNAGVGADRGRVAGPSAAPSAPAETSAQITPGDMSPTAPRRYETRKGEPGEFNAASTGEFGPANQKMTTIRLKNGQTMQVNPAVADRFKGYYDEMIDRGYPVDVRGGGGYANRNKRGGGGPSMHAYGTASDINVKNNPMAKGGTTDMPEGAEQLAWKHGLSWGGRFGDPMHFEAMSRRAWDSKKKQLQARGLPSEPGAPPVAAAPSAPAPTAEMPPVQPTDDTPTRNVDQQVRLNMKVNDNEVQFARSSMRRQADREVREARWSSYSDIGAA